MKRCLPGHGQTVTAIGSMFSGIGGLELGLERAGIGTVAWQAEIDPNASEVLAKHWPGSRNLGDVSQVRWSDEHRVDVLCAGFPCQPASTAGRREGMADERWLWPEVARALDALRPAHLVAENVPGLLTVNGGDGFRQVIMDLHRLGYSARWGRRSAASVGACHLRRRLFIWASAEAQPLVGEPVGAVVAGQIMTRQRSLFDDVPLVLPREGGLVGGTVYELVEPAWGEGNVAGRLLPTPAASGFNDGEDLDNYVERRRRLAEAATNGNGCGVPLAMLVRLLPTPLAADARGSLQSTARNPRDPYPTLSDVSNLGTWEEYEPALEHWATVRGEPWPSPTVQTPRGDRLSGDFVRWMMGFEPGWIEGMSRAATLRLFGNAVVPQVAEAVV